MINKYRKRAGFTLLELLLVIVLISILAAMTIPRFVGRSEKAKIAAAHADVNANLSIALDLYELDNGTYPTSEQGLQALVIEPDVPPLPRNWQGPYIKGINRFRDAWGNPYQYVYPGTHNQHSYDLFSKGPDGLDGTPDDVTNWIDENQILED